VIVLGFDTATPATAVALLAAPAGGAPVDCGDAEGVAEGLGDGVAEGVGGTERRVADGDQDADRGAVADERRHEPAPGERPGHGPRLLALAHELLEAAALTFRDVDRIAVGVGPGGFTGLRIGVATARALAQAADAEIVGVSTLRALAAGARPAAGQGVLAVVDARRGEVFVGGWRGGEQVLGPLALAPSSVGALAGDGWLAVGDGALRFREDLERAGCVVAVDGSAQHGVSARMICRLALQAPRGTERDLVVPDYVREPDAVLPRQKHSP
jgi:tRNA threonylcarbamoyladenosine biosynthesis protein TsaB